MATASDVLAVVVAYGRPLDDIPALRAFDGLDLFVHDNSPAPQPAPAGVAYAHDPSNPGVSAAYNRAFDLARERGRHYVLLLDQDSVPEPGAVEALESALAGHSGDRLLASIVHDGRRAFSPFDTGAFFNHPLPLDRLAPAASFSLAGRGLINSGLVVPLALVDRIGGFDPGLPLDFSDTEFVDRYRRVHRDVVLMGLRLRHSLSGAEGRDAARELARFEVFCAGASRMAAGGGPRWRLTRHVAFRAARLAVKYRTPRPLGVAWRRYVRVSPGE